MKSLKGFMAKYRKLSPGARKIVRDLMEKGQRYYEAGSFADSELVELRRKEIIKESITGELIKVELDVD